MTQVRALEVEDAVQYLVQFIRGGPKPQHGPHHGYDVYLPSVAQHFLVESGLGNEGLETAYARRRLELTRAFGAAAWELCRAGF